jgi:Sec-independent protein secretion pathway component TatC
MIKTKQQQKQPKKQNKTTPPSELTFLEHVHELRRRLFLVVLVLVVTSAAGLQMKDQLIAAVMAPLHGEKLILHPEAGLVLFSQYHSTLVHCLLSHSLFTTCINF